MPAVKKHIVYNFCFSSAVGIVLEFSLVVTPFQDAYKLLLNSLFEPNIFPILGPCLTKML